LGRQVALKKLLHSGDTKTEARFRREIRALGKVDHPHLVKIYLSGADGEQWFYAMELVEGANLAAVCDRLQSSADSAADVDLRTWHETLSTVCVEARQAEKPLSDTPSDPPPAAFAPPPSRVPTVGRSYVRHVVELIQQVAEAAHALHEAGIVHRDMKPGNIMVTADGSQAVLMDLGLAQLADEVEGRLTRTRQFVGTVRYASPEQVLAVGQLDRRTDIYSLGATLWELLTLRPMFGATEQTPTAELMQRIQYEEPARLRKYHPGIPRDVDAIVLRCLEKDPKRRYASAQQLAQDLQRFLSGEPVQARPVGQAERVWRWCRRNRAIAGLLVVVTLSLVFGLVVSTWQAVRATRAEAEARGNEALAADKARQARQNEQRALQEKSRADQAAAVATKNTERAQESLNFLVGLFEASDPLGLEGYTSFSAQAMGETLSARDILERGAKKIQREINDPEIRAVLLDHIGNAFRSLGYYDQASPLLQEALDLHQKMGPKESLEAAASLHNLAWLYHDRGNYAEAERLYRQALAIRIKQLGPDDLGVAITQFNLAWLLTELEDFDKAEPLFRAVLDVRRRKLGDKHREVAIAMAGLASLYLYKGQNLAQALGLSNKACQILLDLEGNEHLAQAFKLFQEGVFTREILGNYDEAKRLLTRCLGITKKALGERHIYVSLVLHELAFTLHAKGELADAARYYRECLAVVRNQVGLGHPMAIHPVKNYAWLLYQQRDTLSRPVLAATVVALRNIPLGSAPFAVASGVIPSKLNTARARELFEELVAAQRRRFAKEPIFVAKALTEYGEFLRQAENRSQAKEPLCEALDLYRKNQRGYQPKAYTQCLFSLARVQLQGKDFAAAERLAQEAVPRVRKQYGTKHRNVAVLLSTLGAARLQQKNYSQVEQILREALAIFRQQGGDPIFSKALDLFRRQSSSKPVDAEMEEALGNLVRFYQATGRPAAAVATALERPKEWSHNPEQLYRAACEVAQSVPLVGNKNGPLTGEQRVQRQRFADQAVELIGQAIGDGFGNVKQLQSDQALAPIRAHTKFQKMVADLVHREQARTSWGYRGGYFRRIQTPPICYASLVGLLASSLGQGLVLGTSPLITGALWAEPYPGGMIYFKEVARTPEYVEMYDGNRRMTVRLYSTRMFWRTAGQIQWNALHQGSWQDWVRPPSKAGSR
jgi:tetratricopeptide (TPR) repeat protein